MKNCKYCGIEIKNNLYCSEWCRGMGYSEYRNKKKKDNFINLKIKKIRKCECGNLLVKFARRCDECRIEIIKRNKNKNI